ncbi:unnamed protein product [Polarella glacialis]|uniref:Uncharacterized protein n=1 Tax=Polarella glacialis TaxID=89957 RepID=A0A813JPP5_POLGL|nr:unnamed protein product [Polarella glacialis]
MANVTDFLGNTALHRAMTTGARSKDRQEACSALLRSPCFTALGASNSNGQTALHLAALKLCSRKGTAGYAAPSCTTRAAQTSSSGRLKRWA